MPSISFIYPIHNRAHLFKATLETFGKQWIEPDEYELLVIDDGSTDNVHSLCRTFRDAHGLPIRYCKVDVHRQPFPVFQWHGANNPALAINLGIKAARGARVVLSSPEILHAKETNVLRLATWPIEPMQGLIGDVWDETMRGHPELRGYISGGPRQRYLHFLGVFWRADLITIGGMEEEFISGWGSEDTEFTQRWVDRWGGTYVFTGDKVQAVHQPHPRPWWGDTPGEEAVKDAVVFADELANRCRRDPRYRVANPDRAWGDSRIIVEEDGWSAEEEVADGVLESDTA